MRTELRVLARATVTAVAGAALYAGMALAVTTSFTLTGDVLNPGVYDRERLQSFPAQDRGVGSDVYTGASFWGVLNGAGIALNPNYHNDVLNKLVIATASDGYQATFSLGEIHPNFGGAGEPHIVAYDINNEPLTFNGFARMVSPDDARRGRFVSNLSNLQVVSAARSAAPHPGGPSDSFTLTGTVGKGGTITANDFAGLAEVTREVTYQSGSNVVTQTFTGVALWDLLNARELDTDDLLRKALVVTATDGHQVTFALGELSPSFGDPESLAMVALADSNGPLIDNGFARLVLPGDVRGGRFISNISAMHVVDATSPAFVPLPAGLVLVLTGFIALAGTGRLRQRAA